MQGQSGAIGSLPETLEFESQPSSATVNPQICWNNLRNPAENQIPEYILPPGDVNPSYVNPIDHGWQNLSGWSLGEPSYSSSTQNEASNNEQKRELGWSSSISFGSSSGPRQGRLIEPTVAVPMCSINTNPMYLHDTNSHLVSQNLNLNAALADSSTPSNHHLEHANLQMQKSSGPINEHIPPTIGSGPLMLPSRSNGFLFQDTDGRPGSSAGTRHAPCKRKAVEQSVGQSSDGGSSSYSQHTDGVALNAQDYVGSSISRPALAEQASARLGLSMGDGSSESAPNLNVAGSSETFRRNIRLRVNPSSQQTSVPPPAFPTGSVVRNSGVTSSSPMLPRFHPVDHSQDVRLVPPVDTMIPQSQPLLVHVPALPRNLQMQSIRWSGASSSSSTNNHPLNSLDNVPHTEASARTLPRNILEHPVFAPGTNLRNLVRHPANRASGSANLSIPGNVASSSRTGSHSAIDPSSASLWVSRPNPQQYPRRLSEYVRRSLFPPGSEAPGSLSNNYPSTRGPDSRALPSGAHPGLPSWLERPGDHEHGIPYSLRSLAAAGDLAVAGEGSSRLVSELRNVLGIMRRGRSLALEDVMILNQSVFSGIADIHDRHRDMRLDVDNMSYEELLALEDRIGNVSTGLSEEIILKRMKKKKYSVETGSQQEAEPCCVCQEEYNDGDDIGSLGCGHEFHSNCIKQWLMRKNLCPICKTTGLAT